MPDFGPEGNRREPRGRAGPSSRPGESTSTVSARAGNRARLGAAGIIRVASARHNLAGGAGEEVAAAGGTAQAVVATLRMPGLGGRGASTHCTVESRWIQNSEGLSVQRQLREFLSLHASPFQ